MSAVSDFLDRIGLGGDLIFQDHRKGVDPNMRYSVKGARVEGDDGALGIKVMQGLSPISAPFLLGSTSTQRTVGDVFPWGFIPEDEDVGERGEGSWNPCFAAIVISDTGPGETPTEKPQDAERPQTGGTTSTAGAIGKQLRKGIVGGLASVTPAGALLNAAARALGNALQGSNSSGTQTQGEATADSMRTVLVRLVHTKDYQADIRYPPVRVSVPPDTPQLAAGTAGVILFATREEEQVNLFLPTSAAGVLICVNAAGDPEKSTLVYDLDSANETDPDRAAQLHTVWRVVPPKAGACSPRLTDFPILSWQCGLSGQDEHAGTGLFTDNAATGPSALEGDPSGERKAEEPETKTEEELKAEKVDKLRARRAKVQAAITRLADIATGNPGVDQSAFSREIAKKQAELRLIDDQLSALGSGSTTRDPRDSDGTGARDPKGFDEGVLAQAHACASARMSGPLEVGRVDDVHRIGVDVDGNPINAGHLGTGSLFLGGPGDGPLDFESVRYSNPQAQPNRSPVHLRWDPGATHEWACGSANGAWRLEAETPVFDGVPEVERRNVLERGGTRVGDGGTHTHDQDPGSAAGDKRNALQSEFTALEDELGLPTGVITSGGVTGATHEQYVQLVAEGKVTQGGMPCGAEVLVGDSDEQRGVKLGGPLEGCAAIAKKLAIQGGMIFKASATAIGEQDFSHGGFYDASDLAKAQNAPAVAGFSVLSETRTGGWQGTDWEYANEPKAGKGGTGQGVVHFASAELTPLAIIEAEVGDTKPTLNLYRSTLGFGAAVRGPAIGTTTVPGGAVGGFIGSGFGLELDQATKDLLFNTLDAEGVVTATATLLAGTSGVIGGAGIGGATGGVDNNLLRADGVGGSTLQSSVVLLDDNGRMENVVLYGYNGLTGEPLATGLHDDYFTWVDDTNFATPQIFFFDGTASFNLLGGGLPHTFDGVEVHGNAPPTVGIRFNVTDVTWALPTSGADYVLNFQPTPFEARSPGVNRRNQVFVTMYHDPATSSAALPRGGFDVQADSASSGRSIQQPAYIFGWRTSNTGANGQIAAVLDLRETHGTLNNGVQGVGPLVTYRRQPANSVGVAGVKCFHGLRAFTTGANASDTFNLGGDSATTGLASFLTIDFGNRIIDFGFSEIIRLRNLGGTGGIALTARDTDVPGYNPAVGADDLILWNNDGDLLIRKNGGTFKNLCANTGNDPGEVVTQHTSASGATITQQGNEFTVVVPASGSVAITVSTPFIPGGLVEYQAVVSVVLGGTGGLTGFQVGDGTDVDRFGEAFTITLNTSLTRDDWTITSERISGIYFTATQAGVTDIVITPVGGDWDGGTIMLVLHQKAATVLTF